jgi:tRNA threonylcarbamoyladenosine modification (KEOPS) complex  Pcc1 subunit
MDNKIHLSTSVRFKTQDEAIIIFESIFPEIEDHKFDRSRISMDIKTDTIVITITSNDITAAKANFNAIMRWISVVSEAIQLIPKKIVKN